ncbi:unnamed protein product [Adineta steineri]|uniref:Uncharacterized protein n=1 Tax=Adineta steineri TaxID=433720 RepID=A0A814DFP6_9BILA|nr:unnamed protein product [Adineta steineri]CAF3644587.1 unnamed protein product [Adineta steineri]
MHEMIDLNSIPQSSTTTSGIDLASQYFFGCYPLLCRLLHDSLLRQQKCNSRDNLIIALLNFENVNHDTSWHDLIIYLSTFCTLLSL